MTQIVEAIKPLAWPLVALILGLVFIILFRKPIGTLIPLIRRVSPTGIETAEPVAPTTQTTQKPEASLADNPYEELIRALDSMAFRETENVIRKELQKRNLSETESVKILTRYLASTFLAYRYEILYQQIWGSQLAILQFLNTQDAGATEAALQPFYINAARRYSDVFKAYPFVKYLAFLESNTLIVRTGNMLQITHFGRLFLVYLVHNGKRLNKWY